MSSYREDTQETAVASDSTWAGLHSITEEIVRITEAVLFGVMVLITDSAIASDTVSDSVLTIVTESATASDTVTGHLSATTLTEDTVRASDRFINRLLVLHSESATATDTLIEKVRSVITEHALVSDEALVARSATALISESAKASDATFQAASVLSVDSAVVSDTVIQKLLTSSLVVESATASDQVSGTNETSATPVIEHARATSEITGHLLAVSIVEELAFAEDIPLGTDGQWGQAWTANVESWAMSRYSPYTFEQIAVIDGVAYGISEEGVYALDGGPAEVAGSLTFGKLDLGKGGLVHPIGAYLEYELGEGSAHIDISTTQSGQESTYTYQLADKLADELTNGRFIFGKGLRGRHFQLTLRLNAERAYINDLSVEMTKTKRRV